jgi:hypothetical protein
MYQKFVIILPSFSEIMPLYLRKKPSPIIDKAVIKTALVGFIVKGIYVFYAKKTQK